MVQAAKVSLSPAILYTGRPRVISQRKDGVKIYGLTIPAHIAPRIDKTNEYYVAIAPVDKGTEIDLEGICETTGYTTKQTYAKDVCEQIGLVFTSIQEELAKELDQKEYETVIEIVERHLGDLEDIVKEIFEG